MAISKYFSLIKGLMAGDQLAKFQLLTGVGRLVLPKYRFKWPQMAWWDDEEFNAYLRRFGETSSMNADRRWMLQQLQRLTAGVGGDTAECGAYKGASSFLICKNSSRGGYKRDHFIFDSFEGLSSPSAADGNHWKGGDLSCGEEAVSIALADMRGVKLFKGWIPSRFSEVESKRFSFVHIDVDLYEPTLDSIKFFYPRMNDGGIVVCDDYGFTTCPGATAAIDEYLLDKPEKMLSMSCGGGFFIKGCSTT